MFNSNADLIKILTKIFIENTIVFCYKVVNEFFL